MKTNPIKNWPERFKEYEKHLINYDVSSSSGLYFLIYNDEIVYIGKSANVYSRIRQHLNTSEYVFDHVSLLLIANKYVYDILEREFICGVVPKYNKKISTIQPA